MKIRSGFILREVLGSPMVVATGDAARNFRGMIKLNETAGFIWRCLQDGLTKPQIVEKMTETYDVSPEKAATDVAALLRQMDEHGFLEP